MKKWDYMEQHCIFDHGWQIDKDEMLVLTKDQFNAYSYSGHSYRDPTVRTLMIPSMNGCCLIFEGKHFRVEG